MDFLIKRLSKLDDLRLEEFFRVFPITKYAYTKAHMYADIASEIAGRKVESYGYLITPSGANDGIVRDVYLAHNQVVSPTRADVDAIGESLTHRAIKKEGNKVIGWWHSHKGLSLHRHSPTDDENFSTLMYGIFSNNKKPISKISTSLGKAPYTIESEESGGLVRIITGDKPSKVLIMRLARHHKLKDIEIKSLDYEEIITVGYAYSLILTDNHSKPYCEIAVKDPLSEKVILIKNVQLSQIEDGGEGNLDYTLLRNEVIERVRYVGAKRQPQTIQLRTKEEKKVGLESKVIDFISRNRNRLDEELIKALLLYGNIESALRQNYLVSTEYVKRISDAHNYLLTNKGKYELTQQVSETSRELYTLVQEVVKRVGEIANQQITLISETLINYDAQTKRLKGEKFRYEGEGFALKMLHRRRLKRLNTQLSNLEEACFSGHNLLVLWKNIRQVGDKNAGS